MRTFMVGDEMWTVFAVFPPPNAIVGPTLKEGWLCFESNRVLRRLAPIPIGWRYATEKELAELLDAAGEPRERKIEILVDRQSPTSDRPRS